MAMLIVAIMAVGATLRTKLQQIVNGPIAGRINNGLFKNGGVYKFFF